MPLFDTEPKLPSPNLRFYLTSSQLKVYCSSGEIRDHDGASSDAKPLWHPAQPLWHSTKVPEAYVQVQSDNEPPGQLLSTTSDQRRRKVTCLLSTSQKQSIKT